MKMRIGRVLLALAATGMLFAGPAQAARKGFIDDKIGIPLQARGGAPQPADEIKSAIVAAADRDRWKIKETSAERIRLEHSERDGAIWVWVDVSYRAGSFDIRYVDSAGLEYGTNEQGQRIINRNYTKWVGRLMTGIRVYAQRIAGQPVTEPAKDEKDEKD
jgi:hypothetical protein